MTRRLWSRELGLAVVGGRGTKQRNNNNERHSMLIIVYHLTVNYELQLPTHCTFVGDSMLCMLVTIHAPSKRAKTPKHPHARPSTPPTTIKKRKNQRMRPQKSALETGRIRGCTGCGFKGCQKAQNKGWYPPGTGHQGKTGGHR